MRLTARIATRPFWKRRWKSCWQDSINFSGFRLSRRYPGQANRQEKMDPLKIIIFLCNWSPHTAFQTLQDNRADIPPEFKMVRIPCTGRINKSLLFKPFEMGADGVALVGCKPGTCRYGSGTETARSNTGDTREILELLGLGKERLQLTTFLPDDSEALLEFLKKIQGGNSISWPQPGNCRKKRASCRRQNHCRDCCRT